MFQSLKDKFTVKKIPLAQLIGYISKIPGVGKQMVREAAKRSSQRHKCSGCGVMSEVCVGHIIDDPVALLSEAGRTRLFAAEPEVTVEPQVVATPSETASQPELTQEQVENIEKELATAITTTTANDEPQSTTTEIVSQGDAKQVEEGETQPPQQAAATPLPAAPAKDNMDAGVAFASEKFLCTACGSRLGVHCFPGDATNGNKRELMDKLFALFDAMPELIALKLPPAKVKSITEGDIYWVD